MATPTTQEHVNEARRQIELAHSINQHGRNDPAITHLALALLQLADAIEEAHSPEAPAPGDDMIEEYARKKQAWAEYIDRNREAAQ